MTFDLKAQPASISSAICGLRRIVIVFSSLTNKMEMENRRYGQTGHENSGDLTWISYTVFLTHLPSYLI